jgi:hypothetical protein
VLSGRFLALPTNIRLAWKGLPGTNTPPYYEKLKLMSIKSFITLATGVNVIKLFSFVTDDKAYNLEGLSLETLSCQVLEFEGKARANPTGVPFRCFLLG